MSAEGSPAETKGADESRGDEILIIEDWSSRPYSVGGKPPKELAAHEELRYRKFQTLLSARVVDVEELKKLSWRGVPARFRTMVWQLLLGYLPASADRRRATLKRKRDEYRAAVPRYFDVPPESRSEAEQRTLRQILVDIPRTHPDVPLFHQDPVQRSLERLLYVWAIRHPATSYVQGINDIATPLYLAFLNGYVDEPLSCDVTSLDAALLDVIEADTYWCLTNLLDTVQDHYTFGQPGIQRMVFKLSELIHRIDEPLHKHFAEQGLDFMHFAMPWMNCLLLRELPLAAIMRLWDTYLCEESGFERFHVYFCATFLKTWSDKLRSMGFQELFVFLQNLPTAQWGEDNVEDLVSQAFVLQTLFDAAPSHLH